MSKRNRPKLNDHVNSDLLERYRVICALHACYYASAEYDVSLFASEFFYLIGDILEGKPLEAQKIRFVNLERVRAFMKEER